MHRWLAGRTITAAETKVAGFPAQRLVGQTVDRVEAQGKHLLIRLDSGQTVHSHMKMTGSWHVYRAGDRWRKPGSQARLTVTCGDRLAVCFNAPVVELLQPRAEALHPGLAGLGPDVLVDPFDTDEVVRRGRRSPPDLPLGELLLDQRVVAGIGNIWRCESLFADRVNPWTPQSALTDDALRHLVLTASRLMRAQLGPWQGPGPQHKVYKRNGRPCRRCGTTVQSRRTGENARTVYWCPTCQPPEHRDRASGGHSHHSRGEFG
ncbi:MAG: Fpg/Nei family DNA glycosylase, partial [Acidimicrobiales bacterium]